MPPSSCSRTAPCNSSGVQLSTFGKKLVGTPDELPGFAQSMMKIDDPQVVATSGKTHHPFATFTGRDADAIPGTVFQVTAEELLTS